MKKMWPLNLAPKEKIFCWLLFRKRFKTKDRFYAFEVTNGPSCHFCDHIFCSCIFVRDVRRCSNPPGHPNQNDKLIFWLHDNFIIQPCGRIGLEKILLVCWRMWHVRNELNFRNVNPHPARVIYAKSRIVNQTSINWHPPLGNFVKINFDGSVIQRKSVAARFVIMNQYGIPPPEGSRNVGLVSMPLLKLLHFGTTFSKPKKTAINLSKLKATQSWSLITYLHECKVWYFLAHKTGH